MAVFRVERSKGYTVMSNYHLKDKRLTLKAKGLLSMMLSLPDEWNYSTRGLAAICKEGVDSIGAALKELESNGYMIRRQLRGERGRIIDTEYVIFEKPQDKPEPDPLKKPEQEGFSPHTGFPYMVNPDTVNPDTDKPDTDKPDTENPAQSNTKESKNQKSNNDSSIHPSISRDGPCGKDGIDRIEVDRRLIERNIEYDCLVQQYGRERMDEIVELIFETLCSTRAHIRIAGDEYPSATVKSRLLKITSSHIQYVFDTLDRHTGKIRNIKAYMLTTLFNAPATIDHYYRAEVNHQFGGT